MSLEILGKIPEEVAEWAEKNFPNTPSYRPLLGAMEELGELTHAHLKEEQGIRGKSEELQELGKDAIGDIMIFLMHYCSLRKWNFWECLELAWNEVKKRDWIKNKETGNVADSGNH